MYAAAGGASLASRQARQRQRQQKKTQQLQAKLHPPKAASLLAAEHGASTPTRSTSRQFHQLPTNYLRAPQAHGRKLSASYTGQSKLQLLPIDEGDTQSVLHMRHGHAHGGHRHGHGHGHSHGHAHQPPVPGPGQVAHHGLPYQHAHHHYVHVQGRASPKLIHRHSGSSGTSFHHSHLPKSATATLPLVSQVDATPPTTPSAHGARGAQADQEEEEQVAIDRCQIPVPQDNIIVTPATPMASPGHEAKRQEQEQQQLSEDLPEAAAEKQPLTAADEDEAMQPPPGPLERKCSVYRMRRSDAFEQDASPVDPPSAASVVGGLLGKKQLRELQFQQQYEPLILDEPSLVFKGLPNGRKWQPCAYCEEGICVCEHIECAQGRAAWLERGRRCSVQDSQQAAAACHRRWVKRNRIQDASLGGSSDDEDFLGVLRGPSTFANAFLYVGLGTIALGLVIAFVGTGEKGFKTVELRLIGPSLIGLGLVCCILRILFCICPSHCISSGKKARKKNGNKVDADHTTSLLRGENKRVSIARGPSMQRYPITHKRSNSKMLNEGMEALRQIATTSLFMQNEQKPTATNRVVPIIREPQSAAEAPLEMKKLETALNVCEISDDEDSPTTAKSPTIAASSNNAMRTTTAITAMATTTTMTSASTSSKERPPLLRSGSKLSRQRVALHQQQQDKEKEKEQGQSQDQDAKQPQSLSSSSTVKDGSQDGDLLMETSLMVAPPTSADASVAPTTTRPPTQSTSHTGAISRVLSAPLGYDLPSAVPHTYAAAKSSAMSTSRSAASSLLASVAHPESRGESRVRGPLGMPLSALAATAGRYAYPATPSAAATTTTTTSTMSTSLTTTTTTVALLPLPAPPALTTAAATDQSSIPGQVMSPEAGSRPGSGSGVHTTSLSKLLPTTTITTTSTTRTSPAPSTTATATATAMSSLATTSTTGSRASAAATTQFQQQQPQHFQHQQSQQLHSQQQQSQHAQLLQPTRATLATPPAATLAPPGGIFKFPTPLTSSSASSSAPSSASSNGRTPGATLATLAPPPMPMALPTTPSSKFEPELVLSPAKLGQ